MAKLLGIAIPTYNRADCLDLLLQTLAEELQGLEPYIDVIVSDNASTDNSTIVLEGWSKRWKGFVWTSNATNVGPEENFCLCIDRLDTQYFWVLGDDDIPKKGVIKQLIRLLSAHSPDVIYMNSEWVPRVVNSEQGEAAATLHVEFVSQLEFAHRVHVWLTFISGVIVQRQSISAERSAESLRRFTGTKLVQLGWSLPALLNGNRFAIVHEKCILATKGNTGGYALLTVFGANFASIVRSVFSSNSKIANALIRGNLLRYLPGLIRDARSATTSQFAKEEPWSAMRRQIGDQWAFWVLITPMLKFWKPMAWIFFQAWRVSYKIARLLDRKRPAASLCLEDSNE